MASKDKRGLAMSGLRDPERLPKSRCAPWLTPCHTTSSSLCTGKKTRCLGWRKGRALYNPLTWAVRAGGEGRSAGWHISAQAGCSQENQQRHPAPAGRQRTSDDKVIICPATPLWPKPQHTVFQRHLSGLLPPFTSLRKLPSD